MIDRTGGSAPPRSTSGASTTSADLGLPDRLLAIHRFLGELIARHGPDIVARGAALLLAQRPDRVRRRPGPRRRPAGRGRSTGCPSARPRRTRSSWPSPGTGSADKEQVGRMVAVCLGLRDAPTARRCRRRARGRDLGRQQRTVGRPARPARRSWTGPRSPPWRAARRPYERAVREAAGRAIREGRDAARDRVGGRRRRGGRRRLARHRGRRDRLPRLRRAGGLATATPGAGSSCTRTISFARTSRPSTGSGRAEELGFFNLLLTVTGVGPKVALAIVGSRADGRPPARDPPAGPGGPRLDPRDRQEARRAGHLRAQGEGGRGRDRGRRHGAAGGGAVTATSWRRSRPSATRSPRHARRPVWRSGPAAGGTRSRIGSRPRSGRSLRD